MDRTEIIVVVVGVLLIGSVIWFFFMGEGRREEAKATGANAQQLKVTVKDGGYTPDVIVLKQGVPVELDFYRDEDDSCSDQVVLPDFQISRMLPAHETTRVEFTPDKSGEFTFTCGMSMMRGKLVVQP